MIKFAELKNSILQHMLRILLVLFFFTLIQDLVPAQQVPLTSYESHFYTVPYQIKEDSLHLEGNKVLRELAKQVLREPWKVNLQIHYTLRKEIMTEHGEKICRLFLENTEVRGDTLFHQFRLAEVLRPSHMNLLFQIASRKDVSSYTVTTLNYLKLPSDDSLISTIRLGDFDPRTDTIFLQQAELFYDQPAFQRFMTRIIEIHDYYASVAILDDLARMVDTIDLTNTSRLPVHYMQIEEINKAIGRIREKHFIRDLQESGMDIKRLGQRLDEMYKTSLSLTYTFRDVLLAGGAIPWDGNTDYLANCFTGRLLTYVKRSQQMDDSQGTIFQDYLDHYFDQSSFPPEEKVFESLLSRMYPDARPDTIMAYVSERVRASYHRLAKELIRNNQYAEAYTLMVNEEKMKDSKKSLNPLFQENDIRKEAANGIFNAYAGIASSCIKNRQFKMAGEYLDKAALYRKDHPGYSFSDSLFQQVYGDLFFIRNNACDRLKDGKQYAEAIQCYSDVGRSYSNQELEPVRELLNSKKRQAGILWCYENLNKTRKILAGDEPDSAVYYYDLTMELDQEYNAGVTVSQTLDSIVPRVNKIRVSKLIASGMEALRLRRFALALKNFEMARGLMDQAAIPVPGEFDSCYRIAMKNHLMIFLSDAQKKIWTNQFDSAGISLLKVKNLSENAGLKEDEEIQFAMNRFIEAIQQQKCHNLRDSVEIILIRADRGIAHKNFLKASEYLQAAIHLASSFPECMISLNPMRDTLARYEFAVLYQQNLMDARAQVVSGAYYQAISILNQNEQIYQSHRLDRLGFDMESVFDFVASRSNPSLTEQAVAFYQNVGNSLESLRFLRLIRNQGYPVKNSIIFQEQLGKIFAQQSFLINPNMNPEMAAAQFTGDDDWFKILRNSFIEEWTRLKS